MPVMQAGGRQDTPVYVLHDLQPGHSVPGPAIVLDDISTVVIEPACTAHVTPAGDLRVDVGSAAGPRQQTPTECDPIQLAVFSHRCASLPRVLHCYAKTHWVSHYLHSISELQRPSNTGQASSSQLQCRFMGIAEQMGRVLQRTSISVNIKERLDFSCALFDPAGALVANAPHLPVHLGAMSAAIQFQVSMLASLKAAPRWFVGPCAHLVCRVQTRYWGPEGEGAAEGLHPGDVLASNHPQLAGGSHLPDITVITPVFNGGRIECAKCLLRVPRPASCGRFAAYAGLRRSRQKTF